MLDCTLQNFEPHLGSTFQLMVNGQPALELTLAEVEDLTVEDRLRDANIRSQPFSLIFHGPLSPVAAQATHVLNHAELGELMIFLVPLGPDKAAGAMRYQAIFN